MVASTSYRVSRRSWLILYPFLFIGGVYLKAKGYIQLPDWCADYALCGNDPAPTEAAVAIDPVSAVDVVAEDVEKPANVINRPLPGGHSFADLTEGALRADKGAD